LMARMATTPPTTWAPMYDGADDGAIPAKVFENIPPMVMAGCWRNWPSW
jgi:hypothetical protein